MEQILDSKGIITDELNRIIEQCQTLKCEYDDKN